jgi:hypothetical protein
LHNAYEIHNLYLFYTDLLAETFDIASKSTATKNFAWIGFPHETYFVGREDELAKLEGYHSSERIRVAVISGLGGMGKSKLAFQYAKGKKNCTNCVWLRGEDQYTLLSSVNYLAQKLKLQTSNDNGTQEQFEERLTIIRSKINDSDQPWLIIVDNVDSMHELVAPLINTLWKEPNLFIIVTSVRRNVSSKRRFAVLMELSGFSDKDADKFINETLGNSEAGLNRELNTTLQSLPLALDQAVQYIEDQRNNSLKGHTYGIKEFLDEFNNQKHAMEILNYELQENEKTIFTTVKMCCDRIKALVGGEDTVTLLNILSYLDPDGVPLSFLEGIIPFVEVTVEFSQNRLIVLKDYSLILVENEEITIHRVVQRIVPLIQLAIAQSLLKRVVVGTFKSVSNLNDCIFLEREKRQVIIVWNHFKKAYNLNSDYQSAIDEWLVQLDSSLLITQSKKDILAYLACLLGENEGGTHLVRIFVSSGFTALKKLIKLEILQNRLPALTKKYGEDHPGVLHDRAEILVIQSQYCCFNMDVSDSKELETLVAIADKKLEKGHPCTLNIKFQLALCLIEGKKYPDALRIAKDIQPFLKASDPLYYLIGTLVAGCYKALGDVVRASELLEEYSRKRDAMRMEIFEKPQNANLSENEKEEFEKDFLNGTILISELYHLVLKAEKRHQSTELQRSILKQQNQTATSAANRSEAEMHQEMLPTKLQLETEAEIVKRRFQMFFTHERNLSMAIDLVNSILEAVMK